MPCSSLTDPKLRVWLFSEAHAHDSLQGELVGLRWGEVPDHSSPPSLVLRDLGGWRGFIPADLVVARGQSHLWPVRTIAILVLETSRFDESGNIAFHCQFGFHNRDPCRIPRVL